MATTPPSESLQAGRVAELDSAVPPGIELVDWPTGAQLRLALARAGVPRLLAVPAGELPPSDLADDEDWIRVPCDPDDIRLRAEHVLRAVQTRSSETWWIDDQRVLHRGDRTAVLTSSEAAVAEALLANPGHVIPRSALVQRLWPGGPPSERAIDAVIYRLRRRCRDLGLIIRASRGEGFVLEP